MNSVATKLLKHGFIILISLTFQSANLNSQVTPVDALNSVYREVFITITPNGKHLYFGSLREAGSWSKLGHMVFDGKPQYDGDIFCSEINTDGIPQPPMVLESISTPHRQGEQSITADGQLMIFESFEPGWQDDGGPYYQTESELTGFSSKIGLGGGVTELVANAYRDGHNRFLQDSSITDTLEWVESPQYYRQLTEGAALNPDGKSIVISCKDFGATRINFDLYLIKRNADGSWGTPSRLSFCSEYDECAPFVSCDGTLYFSSNRPGFYGGFDLFKTPLTEEAGLAEVANLGIRYNTSGDEYGIAVSCLDEMGGYLIRDWDIFQFMLDTMTQPKPTICIDGFAKDYKGHPLTSVKLKDVDENRIIATSRVNPATGEFSFAIDKIVGNYCVVTTLEDNIGVAKYFKVTDLTSNRLFFELVSPFSPRMGAPISEFTLFFGADSSELRTSYHNALENLANEMLANPSYHLEIYGHTNSLPISQYCNDLSLRRAEEVYYYLINLGIPHRRLDYSGQGKNAPMTSNKELSGRKLNQRVQLKLFNS